MKLLLRAAPILVLLFAAALSAQSGPSYQAPPPFKHIIIVFQENRTPDNLFGAGTVSGDCGTQDDFETGVDLQNGGPNQPAGKNTCLAPDASLSGGGGFHGYNGKYAGYPNQGWAPQCDYSSATGTCQMDGACKGTYPTCPQYEYVQKGTVKPYFDIATNYGFGNYMFSTHEGPSFEAHQFIFGGTSAPAWPGDLYSDWFGAENPTGKAPLGCPKKSGSSGWPLWVDPDDQHEGIAGGADDTECYDRNTLVTYQDSSGKVHDWTAAWSPTLSAQPAWKYYVPTDDDQHDAVLWNGPKDDPQTCYFSTSGGGTPCNSSEYTTHISVAQNHNMQSAPILSDIARCQLPAISWVIPDEAWSDHPGKADKGMGPDWVATIVDAIGEKLQQQQPRLRLLGHRSDRAAHRADGHLHHLGRLGRLLRSRSAARGLPG